MSKPLPPIPTPKVDNRQHTVLELHRKHPAPEDKKLVTNTLGNLCPGCKKPSAGKKGGLVIGCGLSYFHVDCYKCKKCESLIGIEHEVFVDIDGLLLCTSCFHDCKGCNLAVFDSDNAVYLGEEKYYHPECFRCYRCSQVLDEKLFVRTSRRLYCLGCDEKRRAKLRRAEEKRATRAYGGVAM